MGRTGKYVTAGGIRHFVPNALPHTPMVDLVSLQPVLSDANIALGRIDAITRFIPNTDLFVYMYVRKEAVLSSQIEGTQASLSDLFQFEAGVNSVDQNKRADVDEVVNYIDAMNWGLDELGRVPLSMRLLKGVHKRLLAGTRGSSKNPGNIRRIQNWIGPEGEDASVASFVPPPPNYVQDLLSNLEQYFHAKDEMPAIVRAGVCHAQFESIHPFLDGNGRLGRLLITLLLCDKGVLTRPLLYLSAHFRQHQSQYYQLLNKTREDGDWESWLRFYLEGVRDVANGATETAEKILKFQQETTSLVRTALPTNATATALLDILYKRPVITIKEAAKTLGMTFPPVASLIAEFDRLGLLVEITGRKRDRVYRFQPYIDRLSPS